MFSIAAYLVAVCASGWRATGRNAQHAQLHARPVDSTEALHAMTMPSISGQQQIMLLELFAQPAYTHHVTWPMYFAR